MFTVVRLISHWFGLSSSQIAARIGPSGTLGCYRPHSSVVGSTRPHSALRPYLTLLRGAVAAAGRASLPGLSPVRGQSAGTAASARVTLSLSGPASPGVRPAAQNAAFGPGAGTMPLARQQRREAAGGALRAGKIIKLLPSLPKALVFKQPKARGLSTRVCTGGLWSCPCCGVSRNKGNVVPELWPIRLYFPLGKQNSLWAE
ncbi:uncharacterized protein LOC129120731 [Agelaius phoeniceus]|uniref:uncharacterized protein LOC129120731 n=1 Tax=Agelaius phoeniceus TaxID=39638 RepID=UPI004055343E